MSRKVPTFCRIIDYLIQKDQELATLIRELCLESSLAPRRNPGVTFLLPKDAAFRKKLSDKAISSDTAMAKEARNMLAAHIINHIITTPAEWKTRGEISNALIPRQIVDIKTTNSKEVVFASGAKAEIDANFEKLKTNPKIVVWTLTGGSIPVTNDESRIPKAKSRKRSAEGEKKGSYEVKSPDSQPFRWKIAVAVENEYSFHLQSTKLDDTKIDLFSKYALSLLNYLKKNDKALLFKALPLLAFDKFDFYILLEPHTAANHLIDDAIIDQWWRSCKQYHVIDGPKFFSELLDDAPQDCAVFAKRAELLTAISDLRVDVDEYISEPKRMIERVHQIYKTLETQNKIGDNENVYPAETAEYLRARPGLKALHDELRFVMHNMISRIESSPFDAGALNELFNIVGEYLHASTEYERRRKHRLLLENIDKLISPNELVEEIRIFVSSTLFLAIPLSETEAANFPEQSQTTRPSLDTVAIYNIAQYNYIRHDRILTKETKELVDMLTNLDVDLIPETLQKQLREKLGAC